MLGFALALFLAGPASAANRNYFSGSFQFGPMPHLHLHTANGYKVDVSGLSPFVTIQVSKGSASTSYDARGIATSKGLSANFGDLGEISVRFRPSGKVTSSKPFPNCPPPDRFTTRFGLFVGEIRFRGEGGYTTLNAHRAKGSVQSLRNAGDCPGPHHDGKSGKNHQASGHPVLTATSGTETASTVLTADSIGAPPLQKAFFFAAATERIGPVSIFRVAQVLAPSSALVFGANLSSATVTPPTPFSGTASFQRGADGSTTWAGDLAVSFIGKPDVPLTGTTFSAKLACESSSAGTVVVVRSPGGKRAARRPAASGACGRKVEK